MSALLLPSLLASPQEHRTLDPPEVIPQPYFIDKNRSDLLKSQQQTNLILYKNEENKEGKKNIQLPSLAHILDSQFTKLTPLSQNQPIIKSSPVVIELQHPVSIPQENHQLNPPLPFYLYSNYQKTSQNILASPAPYHVKSKYIESLTKSILRQSTTYANNLAKKATFTVRTERNSPEFDLSIFPDDEGTQIFKQLYEDKTVVINPKKLHFIPTKFWPDEDIPFCDIVDDFFRRKNHINCRFPHKLYNALKLNELGDKFRKISGVTWLSPMVLRVDKIGFSRLLGISSIEGSLFHRQGNFTTHGFSEIGFDELTLIFGYQVAKELVQNSDVRYLKHNLGIFQEGVTEEAIEACKWVSSKRKNYYL